MTTHISGQVVSTHLSEHTNHSDFDGSVYSPFERDIAGQADALRRYAQSDPPAAPKIAPEARYDRVILTGMGSSHYAALPSWRQLVAAGHSVWWLDSGQLLDSPELLTPGSLLVVSSQSGASAEVVALLHRINSNRPAVVVGITNDQNSPLAEQADLLIPLHSGPEATVSTKSYLNTLAAQQWLTGRLTGATTQDISDTIEAITTYARPDAIAEIGEQFTANPGARLAFIGFGDQAAIALYAGLITKEAAKIPAAGYIGGEFRHGPLELAGPGLTAVLFAGGDDSATSSLQRLGNDLLASGSAVIAVGELGLGGGIKISAPTSSPLATLAHMAITAQHLTVALAKAKGIIPGAFHHGNKITTAL